MDKAQIILTAAKCAYNRLWKCEHKDNAGAVCTGPCKLMNDPLHEKFNLVCSLCGSELEFGYCTNLLCKGRYFLIQRSLADVDKIVPDNKTDK